MEVTGERFMPDYPGDWSPEHYHRYFLARELVEGKRVLDIASGEGYGSAILAQLAKHVTGVDISQEAVDAARDKYQKNNLDYVCGSVTAIPLPDHSVDMVVSFETIEHLTEQTEMLAEIRRVLIPEGILVISSPDKLTYSDIPGYHNEFHVKELYEDEFVALLQGFFPQIRLYRQNLEYGSLVSSETENRFTYVEQDGNTFSSHQGLPQGKYIIAVAGSDQLPTLPNSLLKYPVEVSEAVAIRQQHVERQQKEMAGNDMLQPGLPKQYEAIVKGVQDGALDEAILNQNVKRILEMILQTPHFKGYKYSNKPDLKAHAAVTRQSATEGMVLLKNDNGALPLAADVKNVALFGCTSYDFIAGGTGSGNVNRAYTVSLLDGLKNAGYVVDEALKNSYEAYLKTEKERLSKDKKEWFMPDTRPAEMAVSAQVIREQAAKADVALVTLGRTSGEFLDRMVADFNLTKEEQNMLKAVSDAFHAAGKKVVVVLNIGGVIETASWKSAPDAILCAWQAGQEAYRTT